jgi:hypothetical protein
MPRDVLFERLRAAEAEGGAAQGAQGPTPPADSPLNQPFDYNALTPEGKQQAAVIFADKKAGKIAEGIAAARLQALPRAR